MYIDIDECALVYHNCDNNAVCSNNNGSYACTCIEGYYGSGHVCIGWLHFYNYNIIDTNHNNCNFTDIDECEAGTHRCHKNAVCSNTNGSYTCQCETSFFGDGFMCTCNN